MATDTESVLLREAAAIISRRLAAGEDVTILRFGTFKIKTAAARRMKKPGTDVWIDVPAKTVVRFKASKSLLAE